MFPNTHTHTHTHTKDHDFKCNNTHICVQVALLKVNYTYHLSNLYPNALNRTGGNTPPYKRPSGIYWSYGIPSFEP